MSRYKKLPVEIEAIQLGWDTWCEVCDFVDYDSFGGGVYLDDNGLALPETECSNNIGLWIETLEGRMLASQYDYIIKGVNGEFYPCKPDVFRKTYEAVDEVHTDNKVV